VSAKKGMAPKEIHEDVVKTLADYSTFDYSFPAEKGEH
jgi:hypothetical protein